MKKIKSIYIVLSICIFAFYSCSTDADDNLRLLKKTISTSKNGEVITKQFSYNGTEIESTDDNAVHVEFTYTDGLISKKVTLNKVTNVSETVKYTYDAGKLVSATSLKKYLINYTHNADRTVSYEKLTLSSDDKLLKEYHGILYFQNENLVKDERVLDNTAEGTVSKYTLEFEFDSKNNPFFQIKGFNKLLDNSQLISESNCLVITEASSLAKDDKIISSAKFHQSNFIYDSSNYPKEQISQTSIFNTSFVKIEYFY